MNEGIQNTHPLLVAPLAFAARRANETQQRRAGGIIIAAGRRPRPSLPPAAHVDVLIQPAPPDDAPRVLIAYPPVGYSQDHNASVEIFIHVAGCVEINPVRRVHSAMTLPCWPRRAMRSRHRHAIEQASHRWRGGRREDPARTAP